MATPSAFFARSAPDLRPSTPMSVGLTTDPLTCSATYARSVPISRSVGLVPCVAAAVPFTPASSVQNHRQPLWWLQYRRADLTGQLRFTGYVGPDHSWWATVADMQNLDLVGGHVALDFANTGSLEDGPASERLVRYADVVTFAVRTRVIGGEGASELRALANQQPGRAEAVLEDARELRDIVDHIFTAIATGGRPADVDIAGLNRFLEEGMRHRRLEPDERCCGWSWSAGEEPLARMLWPIAAAAAELLVEGDLERVKRCGNDSCGWLFVDLSRNRSRRWCDMRECGNRAKARRHYARRRDSGAAGSV